MTQLITVAVPDIGDVKAVDIIDVLVAVGDEINIDDPLLTLETDKATMDVPSNAAGKVSKILVKVGDKVSQGDLIVELESGSAAEKSAVNQSQAEAPQSQALAADKLEIQAPIKEQTTASKPAQSSKIALKVPDIGDARKVDVIEVYMVVGDQVEKEQSLILLETDKATMEVPASHAGQVIELAVRVGDKVSEGDILAWVMSATTEAGESLAASAQNTDAVPSSSVIIAPLPVSESRSAPVPDHPQMKRRPSGSVIHASPAVRRFARELGADLSSVKGSGPKGRIQKEDVQNFIKFELSRPKATAATGAFAMPAMPEIDHEKWGQVETRALSRIQKVSSVNLHRNWITIPHVTQHEDADITELDEFRKSLKDEALREGVKLTPLAFIIKAVVHSLKAFPKFNASLAADGENLVIKHYYHIGVAVETPDGLTVPVIRDVDQKGIFQLATELGEISQKARDKKLSADDMQGSSFTISSLGGIGGTGFTPIVKWPDVAILGLSRHRMQPVWNGRDFVPRLMLPMSLSYDHRVIDGADAARFAVHLSATLKDIRRVLLK